MTTIISIFLALCTFIGLTVLFALLFKVLFFRRTREHIDPFAAAEALKRARQQAYEQHQARRRARREARTVDDQALRITYQYRHK